MSIFGSVKSQLRSVIEWTNVSPEVVFEKWTENSDELKNASKLIVGPGQGCVFVYEGKVQAVVLQSGITELKTANIPFWTTITKFMQSFVSEHKVGLYFFKQTILADIKWGTTSPVKYDDPKYKFPVGLRAFGNFSVKIDKPDWFFQTVMGARDVYTVGELKDLIVSRIMQPLTDSLAQAKLSYAEVDSHRNEIAQSFTNLTRADFEKLGFLLADFRVEGTSFDEDTMKRINRIADMTAEAQAASAVGLNFAQMQQLEALKDAAKNPGGGAGVIVGLGAGMGLGQQMVGVATQAVGDDISTKLKKLKDLLDQKLISQEEFDTKKKDLLSKL